MQSSSLHLAIILDGNGRWATGRGLPREAGHLAGAEAVRRIVRAAPELGVRILTLYAFSSDNWSRPAAEVRSLLELLGRYLGSEREPCAAEGVRLAIIGRRDRLPAPLRGAITLAERATAHGRRLLLRLAIDYSSRDQILRAAERAPRPLTRQRFASLLGAGASEQAAADVDLLIRTGGEQRLSDFLLWECAYAELYFTDTPWPDFDRDHLAAALAAFHRRQRRFGGLEARDVASGGGRS
ncbi:MAG TPA: di-trans,poly-cis-decaprenylcistransferase [Gemmatimonadales bacterium]|nr:di-trans,poly-cis-decaprenylcistransferase [Gemmatimonadales bacterium]